MQNKLLVKIGHLRITDHLILGLTKNRLKTNELSFTNLDLENTPMNSWSQMIENLIEKNIHGAFMPVPAIMDLFDKGFEIKLLLFTHRSGSQIVKNKFANIRSLLDFKGKTILAPHSLSMQNMLCHRLLSSAGLKFGPYDDADSDVFMEVVSPNIMPEMLKHDMDGHIGGYVVAEPFAALCVNENFAQKLFSTDKLWENHPCCAFVLSDSIINEFPEAVEELVAAFIQSGTILDQKEDENILLAAREFLAQEMEIVKTVIFESEQRFAPDMLVPDIKSLEIIQDYMVDTMGVLKNRINLDDLISREFSLRNRMDKTN